jgi:hypothetical protein
MTVDHMLDRPLLTSRVPSDRFAAGRSALLLAGGGGHVG